MSALITAALALKRLFSLSCLHHFFLFRFQASWAHRRDRRVCCNSAKWHTRARARTRTSPFPSLLCWAEGSGCWRVTTTLLCSTCLHFTRKLGLVFADRGCSKKKKKKSSATFFLFSLLSRSKEYEHKRGFQLRPTLLLPPLLNKWLTALLKCTIACFYQSCRLIRSI